MIKSYVELIKYLKQATPGEALVNGLFEGIEFQTGIDDEFNGFPVATYYAVMPVVIGEDITVKVVIMKQGDSYAIITPDNVGQAFQKLKDDDKMFNLVNTNLTLVVDNSGFEDSNALYELVKRVYLSSGQYLPGFGTNEIVSKQQETNDEVSGQPQMPPANQFGSTFKGSEVEQNDELLDTPELKESKKAFKQFKKQTRALESLVKDIEKMPQVLTENIDIKLVNGALLAITVDNKSIYEELNILPKAAKKLISQFGEGLKSSKHIQLVETYSTKDGKRTFIVAEAAGNNYWVSEEDILQYTLKSGLVEIDEKDLIILNESSVRMNERKRKAFVNNNVILFEDSEV